ncbi:MAG: hypothetical protein JSS27_01705 [Planctomycetes bacterium]|nr:hypothetical protein [Planctomycetota bacterium]
MLKRAFMLATVGGAAGLPVLMSSSDSLRDSLYDKFGHPSNEPVPQVAGAAGSTTHDWQVAAPPGGAASNVAPPNQPSKLEVQPIWSVLRFDVSPAWVLGNWSRVSTSLADVHHSGYRVPLVTGTNAADLAGSLTYYFNQNQQVERIMFQGTTGDARPLVDWLASQYQFQRMIGPDPNVYLYQVPSQGTVRSELRIVPVSVVRQAQPNARFDVNLVMQRPAERR